MAELFRASGAAVTTTNTFVALAFGTSSSALVRTLSVCNTHNLETASITIQMAKSADTSTPYVLFQLTQVTAQQTVQPLSGPLALEPGDQIQVRASHSAHFHVVASSLQIF